MSGPAGSVGGLAGDPGAGAVPSGARAAWLLARLRLRRLLNMATLSLQRKPKPGNGHKARRATAGKRRVRWVVPLVVAALMTFAFTHMSNEILLTLQCKLAPASACAALSELHDWRGVAADELRAGPFSAALLAGIAMELTILWLVALLVPLASREMAQPDWDLEWLVTLPVRRASLLWARVAERTVTNPTGMLVLLPATGVLAWHGGLRWLAPPTAIAATLVLLALAAALRTLADTGLRLTLPPSQLRNLQAAISVLSMPLIYVVISLSSGSPMTLGWARDWPAWAQWTPPGLVAQWLGARSLPASAGWFALLAAQTAVLLWAAIAVLNRQLAQGVVAASSREAARSARRPPPARALPGTPLQRRELRLLSRDRTFLVQSLVVPLVIIGSQMFFSGRLEDLARLGQDQAMLASIAFGLGSYVLLLSAFQTINTEGQALWLLYTFPGTLERMLAQKARLWAVLALAYPAAVFAAGIGVAHRSGAHLADAHLAARIVLVAIGIPLFALIAVALGVWASNPLATEPGARIRPTYVYLYSLLAALYGYALYTNVWPHRLAVVVFVAALALALWQKARDHLPYLLDPTAAPPPRVSAVDGMAAGLLFFAVQAIAFALLHRGDGPPALSDLAIALAIAGAVVYGIARLIYWRLGTSGVPVLRHGPANVALLTGALWSVPAIGAGALTLRVAEYTGIDLPLAGSDIALPLLLLIACVAAPLCEEFIFRGLLFGGLRRSLPPLAAMAVSAALFAAVHPPVSMAPVFVLGLCAAFAYHRNGGLLAPVVTHMVYNGAMIALQA